MNIGGGYYGTTAHLLESEHFAPWHAEGVFGRRERPTLDGRAVVAQRVCDRSLERRELKGGRAEGVGGG